MAYVIPYAIAGAATAYQVNQQAQAQERQQQIDEANARTTMQQANAAEEASRRKAAAAMGDIRAAAASTGFDPGTGSLLNLQAKSAGEMELDILTNRYRRSLEAIGLRADASVQGANARATRISGALSAYGTMQQANRAYGSARPMVSTGEG